MWGWIHAPLRLGPGPAATPRPGVRWGPFLWWSLAWSHTSGSSPSVPRPGTVSPCHPKPRAQPLPFCCASEEGLGQRRRLPGKGQLSLAPSPGRPLARESELCGLSTLPLATSERDWRDPRPLLGILPRHCCPHQHPPECPFGPRVPITLRPDLCTATAHLTCSGSLLDNPSPGLVGLMSQSYDPNSDIHPMSQAPPPGRPCPALPPQRALVYLPWARRWDSWR